MTTGIPDSLAATLEASQKVADSKSYDLVDRQREHLAEAISTVAPNEGVGYGVGLVVMANPQTGQHMPALQFVFTMPSLILGQPIFASNIHANLSLSYEDVLTEVRTAIEAMRATKADGAARVAQSGPGLWTPGR